MTENGQPENLNIGDSGQQTIAPVESKSDEPLVRQSKVNEIVHARTKDAYEKGRREALGETQKQQTFAQQSQAQPQQLGGMQQQLTPEQENQFRQLIAEHTEKL